VPTSHRGLGSDGRGATTRSAGDRFDDAAEIFREVSLREEFPAFLTLGAYSRFLVDED
jgi:malate synthase